MNDITALMATMKAAADKAREVRDGQWNYDHALEGVYSSAGRFVTDASKMVGEHIAAACPANVRELVEALKARDKQIAELVAGRMNLQRTMGVYVHAYEEAKSHISELEQRNNRLSDWGGKIEKLLKSTEESLIYSVDMVRGLESRTVTVKLPAVEKWRKPDAVRAQNAYRVLVVNDLAAAGIQVIEGEGQ